MDINISSYNTNRVINYYSHLSYYGLFSYEKKIIEKYFVGKKVLDIGCGTGRTTSSLYNMGFDVIGIDYSEGMIKKASEINPQIKYEIGNCIEMRFKDNSFDNAIFSFNGIMLEKEYNLRKKIFMEIYRVLTKNGIFFFTTPYIDNKVNLNYWKEKKEANKLDLSKKKDRLILGDEFLEDDGVHFFIHIPFCEEIEDMISTTGFKCVCKGSRINDFGEEKVEADLDDNYYWVVKK